MTDHSDIITSSNSSCTSRMAPARVRIVRLVGDQIIRVNGYIVDDAVHRELSQYISCANRLTLRVRSKSKMTFVWTHSTDLLTWHIVPKESTREKFERLDQYHCRDVRINLKVAPRTKLGLGICKGPEWKPGVFVQFTKDVGIARETGLRPGDQILSCNGVDFTDIAFSDAVAAMKQSQDLELIVRTGAGLNLFPGESSGYNSSASSITGDQSPCWNDQSSKRLSIVKEEDCAEKIGQNRLKYRNSHNCKNKGIYVVNPSIGEEPVNIIKRDRESNTTIIKLSENGTEINSTLIPTIRDQTDHSSTIHKCGEPTTRNDNSKNTVKVKINSELSACNNQQSLTNDGKLADICFVSRKCSTKTVIVEVHRGTSDQPNCDGKVRCKIPPPPPIRFCHQEKTVPSNITNVPANNERTSLNSAIGDELKRRLEGLRVDGSAKTRDMVNNKRSVVGGDNDKHNALMDEFKKAHQKMFKNGFCETDSTQLDLKERQLKLQQQQANEQSNKVLTPDPDYDITPPNSLDHTTNQLIDKVKVQQSEAAPIRQCTNAPAAFKATSSVAIKIGEYADRKEPCKFHFISKFGSNESNGDVTSQLKNELEKTLSKLNIQNKKDTAENGDESKNQEHLAKEIPSQRSTSNVEKITALLITQNQTNCKSDAQKTGNKFGVKKTESLPLNGILKVGSNSCSEHKNISFGKTTTTLVDNET
ncbi:hypothetical protein HA402_006625 [Bradysia odoriphaga]|nr:hypothetical protein HA402_006625 [Bradysia odoriphaga]